MMGLLRLAKSLLVLLPPIRRSPCWSTHTTATAQQLLPPVLLAPPPGAPFASSGPRCPPSSSPPWLLTLLPPAPWPTVAVAAVLLLRGLPRGRANTAKFT